ncbi:vWA domain-containing protein [Frankia tisae]|uniref:vWA domain-containing protein n=1 Tax=Frankia tisae TaxID=2950104 RepID=UPI0021C17D1C|nr:VWA domain-containing protein [Frankia tisae]
MTARDRTSSRRFGRRALFFIVLISIIGAALLFTNGVGWPMTLTTFISGLTAAIGLDFTRQSSSQDPHRGVEIMGLVALIEENARTAVSSRLQGEPDDQTVSTITPALVAEGIWTSEDANEFRRVLRVRNSIAHSGPRSVTEKEVREAKKIADGLLAKLDRNGTSAAPISINERMPTILLVLCIDTSASIEGPRLNRLNEALNELAHSLQSVPLLANLVEISTVTFGSRPQVWRGDQEVSEEVENPFLAAAEYLPPTLFSAGSTSLGGALRTANRIIDARVKFLRSRGRRLYRPQLWVVTDGLPTDEWEAAADEIAAAQEMRKIVVYGVNLGRDERVRNVLDRLLPRHIYEVEEVDFSPILSILTDSIKSIW